MCIKSLKIPNLKNSATRLLTFLLKRFGMNNYSKGSEWRKWDLHVHTPFSVLCNNFAGNTFEKKWRNYIAALEKIKDIAVLGVTDYFSIEGYKKILMERSVCHVKHFDSILPNV